MSDEENKARENEANTNPFDDFSSRIKRLYIPLHKYHFFHQPSTPDKSDPYFVGRQRIIDTLKNWLKSKDNPHGVYLITGYRGMGKSSVVGKTIKEFVADDSDTKRDSTRAKVEKAWDIAALVYLLLSAPIIMLFYERWHLLLMFAALPLLLATLVYLFVRLKHSNNKAFILHVSVSVGDEINNERDVLAVIADAVRTKFKKYLQEEYTSYWPSLTRRVAAFGGITSCFAAIRWSFRGDAALSYLGLNGIIESPFAREAIKIIVAFSLAVALLFLAKRVLRLFTPFLGTGYKWLSAREVERRLEHCCDRINATMGSEIEHEGVLGYLASRISLRHKRYKEYPFATVREIEAELMQIFEIMNESMLVNSQLIIVVDELDKLVIESNKENTKELDLPEFAYTTSGLPGGNSYRVKKNNLLYMLGQLKTFLSSARAKFIFIAGRELYDSYKENADREYSIYMFDQILNIDSFFSYDTATKDVTRMTERYLCRILLAKANESEDGPHEQLNLSEYFKHCKAHSNSHEELVRSIIFLRHFVTYLTFVSNGAPKKIANQLERYIIGKERYERESVKSGSVTIDDGAGGSCDYYLAFGHYDQQKINFINYMVHPVFRSVISPASEYGDKHLVAASFMLGHIFKHHNGGFSMQNLEYVPELIESTKTPELREFLHAIISFLTQIHINKITTGLYEYKYGMKIYEEISFYSKRSELISGIFNFSRDYSLAVKQYFNDVLTHHAKQEMHSPISLSNIHLYLGDLHLDSEEYSEAISHFDTSRNLIIQSLQQYHSQSDEQNPSLVARLTRAMLKLGLAYEKRNALDAAYLTYCELVNRLVGNRFFDESKFGLDFRLQKTPAWNADDILIFPHKGKMSYLPNRFEQIHPPFVEDSELPHARWSTNSEFTHKLTHHLTKESSALISKISIYEDLRVAYTPLLAKLFSIEKQNAGGITLTDIAVTEAEFRHLFMFTNSKEKYILSADFFRKLGDILYYKNSELNSKDKTLVSLLYFWDYDLVKDVTDFFKSEDVDYDTTRKIIEKIREITIIGGDIKAVMRCANDAIALHKRYVLILTKTLDGYERSLLDDFCDSRFNRLRDMTHIKFRIHDMAKCFRRLGRPCSACKYYDRSLTILSKNVLPEADADTISKSITFLLHAIYFPEQLQMREKELSQIALSLEAMGNTLLSCHGEKERLRARFLEMILDIYGRKTERYDHWLAAMKKMNPNALEKSFAYYFAAAEYYDKLGDTKAMAQCISKVIHAVSLLMPIAQASKHIDAFVDMLRNRLLPRASAGIQASYDFSPLHETHSFKNENEIMLPNKHVPMDLSSNSPDLEELELNFAQILLTLDYLGKPMADNVIQKLYNKMSLGCNRLDTLSYNRVISLYFKVRLNKLMLQKLFYKMSNGKVLVDNETFKERYNNLFEEIESGGCSKYKAKAMGKLLGVEICHGFDFLDFLIIDSIFCLTNIVEYITPTLRNTLFTNNFYGDIYKSLLEWVKIKDTYQEWLHENGDLTRFKKHFERVVSSSIVNLLHRTYLSEMALKYYTKSFEINTEGQAYQDFIVGMTIVDDDLQNDTYQFYLALERFSLRRGNTERKMNEVRMFAKDSGTLSQSSAYRFDRYWGNKDV